MRSSVSYCSCKEDWNRGILLRDDSNGFGGLSEELQVRLYFIDSTLGSSRMRIPMKVGEDLRSR